MHHKSQTNQQHSWTPCSTSWDFLGVAYPLLNNLDNPDGEMMNLLPFLMFSLLLMLVMNSQQQSTTADRSHAHTHTHTPGRCLMMDIERCPEQLWLGNNVPPLQCANELKWCWSSYKNRVSIVMEEARSEESWPHKSGAEPLILQHLHLRPAQGHDLLSDSRDD